MKETPRVPWDDLTDWAGHQQFGGHSDDRADDTEAIQKAIDSGKTTVYLPRGTWVIDGTLHLRGRLRRLIGAEGTLTGKGTIRIEDGESPLVRIERLRIAYSPISIEQATRRTVVISSCIVEQYEATPEAAGGDVFMEDVCGGPFAFIRQSVWARQLNPEQPTTKIVNDGGSLWVLGLKTERGGTLVDTRNGGRTEIASGFCYATSALKIEPMFIVTDSALSVSIGEACFNGHPFQQLVSETRARSTNVLKKGEAPGRAGGSMLALYAGWAEEHKP